MSLTLRGAAEQLFGLRALAEIRAEQELTEAAAAPRHVNHFDENAPPEVVVRDDEEARALADTPHLTGDPEWDAVELAETDPTRAPLAERMRGFR